MSGERSPEVGHVSEPKGELRAGLREPGEARRSLGAWAGMVCEALLLVVAWFAFVVASAVVAVVVLVGMFAWAVSR